MRNEYLAITIEIQILRKSRFHLNYYFISFTSHLNLVSLHRFHNPSLDLTLIFYVLNPYVILHWISLLFSMYYNANN